MRCSVIILTLITLLHFSCSDLDADLEIFRDDPSIQSLIGTWKIISFEDYENDSIEYQNFENSWNSDFIITFDDSESPHRLTGRNTSNLVSADFEYIGKRQIKMKNFFTTYITQPRWAYQFIYALNDSPTFKINRYGLIFYYDNEKRSVTMERVEE
jgi:hypothetical protein